MHSILSIIGLSLFMQLAPANSWADSQFEENIQDTKSCVRTFPSAQEGFEIRKELIRSAKKEILFSYYMLKPHMKPYYLLALLKEASKRGVKVKVILDHLYSKLPKAVLYYLQSMDVEIKYYNPTTLKRLNRLDRRLHDKYIVVDRNLILVGGRNLNDKYFVDDLNSKGTFYDIDALFQGGPAVEAGKYFDERWISDWVENSVNSPDEFLPADLDEYTKGVQEAERLLSITGELNSPIDAEKLLSKECSDTSFQANHPTMIERNRPLEETYLEEIDRAKTSIDLLNAYILFTPRMKKAIKKAVARNVQVNIVANSLQSADVTIQYGAYLNLRRKLLRWGIKVYEFIHPQTMHAKVAIFDKSRAIIGSYNLDPRSANLNSETIILTSDLSAVAPINTFFENSLELSTEIKRSGKPVGHKKRHPGASFLKALSATIYRFTLAPLLRSRL